MGKTIPLSKEQVDYILALCDVINNNAEIARLYKKKFNLPHVAESYRGTVSRYRKKSQAKKETLSKPIKRLFFDIETSPNIGVFWRSGWKQTINPKQIIKERRIICVSYKWQYASKVHTIKWDKDQCDKKLIQEFSKIMLQADEIVGHNSDRFDEKWLRTRAIFHRIPMLPKYKSLDTLKKAKTHFNFQSNSLKYIADFLNLSQKGTPGGLETWLDIMFKNDKAAMKNMVEYCEQDVVVLEDVFHALNPYIDNNTNFSSLKLGNKHNCPECTSKDVKFLKSRATKAGTIQRIMECNSCEKNYQLSNKKYMDHLKESLNLGGL